MLRWVLLDNLSFSSMVTMFIRRNAGPECFLAYSIIGVTVEGGGHTWCIFGGVFLAASVHRSTVTEANAYKK